MLCARLQKSFRNSFTVLNKSKSAERTEPPRRREGGRKGKGEKGVRVEVGVSVKSL